MSATTTHPPLPPLPRGVARIFQGGREGRGALCQSEGTRQIIMLFSQSATGYLIKKGSERGVGVVSRAP